MKRRHIQWLALIALMFLTPSCSLPDMLGRTASNAVNKVGSYANAVADAAY